MTFWNLGFRVVMEEQEDIRSIIQAKKPENSAQKQQNGSASELPPTLEQGLSLFQQAMFAAQQQRWDEAVEDLEKALEISAEMYHTVMQMASPGTYEREISGAIEGIVNSYGNHISFPIILSVHGETLHNHYHGNRLEKNHLLVTDSGAESPGHYASDITRTFPVGGKFTPQQKDIYQNQLKLPEIRMIKSQKADV